MTQLTIVDDPKPVTTDNSHNTFAVSVHATAGKKIPELYNDVLVIGDKYEQSAFARMFSRARCRKAKGLEDCDLVVFTGGTDVDPALYGETPHKSTDSPDKLRDIEESKLFFECVERGIPMLGICRGAQLGHVLNGGKLYQHVDNHYGDHSMYDTANRRYVNKVSSVHHQMCIQNDKMDLIAFSGMSKNRWLNAAEMEQGTVADVEAFFYRDTCFLGIQGHPEYTGYDEFMVWTFETINQYINESPDLVLVDGQRRVKPAILEERLMEKV